MNNKIQSSKIWYVLSIIAIFVLAIGLVWLVPSDPDMGWHIQNGTDIIKNNFSLLSGDIYSWTMPGFPWVPHEWATDIIMAFLYNNFGLVSLSIFFALIIISAFMLAMLVDLPDTKKMIASPENILIAVLGMIASYN